MKMYAIFVLSVANELEMIASSVSEVKVLNYNSDK